MLTDVQRQALVQLARHSVTAQVTGVPSSSGPFPCELPAVYGVFVTLKRAGELRGCLGTLRCRRELAEEVARCAADSASVDPRFPPVGTGELPDISVEVSVLGPLEEIDPVIESTIVVGRHGLVAEQGTRRGLLLPQVAIEWGWTREQFLHHTCIKAGLPADAWRRGARVYRFEAEVFS
jgi:AmmeMemoRadiSam system protein A